MAGRGKAKRIGDWVLLDRLGSGGNAEVWRAARGRADAVALKLLKSTRVGGESYHRFRAEVETLRRIEDVGVLPLLDANLPESPSRSDRAWLSMPTATPIDQALAGAELETIVDAVAAVAETLVRLKDEHGLGHRDVKPGNLYLLDGRWVIGDFGLVAGPDSSGRTEAGRPLGPRHFAASEMIVDPQAADPFPADVYSLAKTLWVLATEQRYPPEGHQPADVRRFSIAEMRPHPNAPALDRLVDSCTYLRAENRPLMATVAAELRAWLLLGPPPGAVDVSAIARRIRERLSSQITAEELIDQQKEAALAAARVFQDRWAPIDAALREAHPGVEVVPEDKAIDILLRTHSTGWGPQVIWRWQRVSRITAGRAVFGFGLRVARSVELLDDGNLVIRAAIDVSARSFGGPRFSWHADDRTVPATAVEPEQAIREVVRDVQEHLDNGMNAFLEHLPEAD